MRNEEKKNRNKQTKFIALLTFAASKLTDCLCFHHLCSAQIRDEKDHRRTHSEIWIKKNTNTKRI